MATAGSTFEPDGNQPGLQATNPSDVPESGGSDSARLDPNETARKIALVGVIVCGGLQCFVVADVSQIALLVMVGLLVWFTTLRHSFPFHCLILGDIFFRMGKAIYARSRGFQFGGDNLPIALADALSLVALIAFGFIYIELHPKRLHGNRPLAKDSTSPWHALDPFRGLAFRLPIAMILAVIVYLFTQQIQSPINPGILRVQYVQGYFLCLVLFLIYSIVRTILDLRAWETTGPPDARYYLHLQSADEQRTELDLMTKPGWSRIDHASKVGGMLLLQMLSSVVMACIFVSLAYSRRWGGAPYLWPAVSTVFVFLTSAYNARNAARSDINAENHVISFVSLCVVIVVGLFSLRIPPWPWGLVYISWCAGLAAITVRMAYCWLLDESYARHFQWPRARPFSWLQLVPIIFEAAVGVVVIYVVTIQIVTYVWNS